MEKTEQEKVNEFVEAYKNLCDEYKLMITVVPTWKQSMDVGDWRLVLQTNVQKLEK